MPIAAGIAPSSRICAGGTAPHQRRSTNGVNALAKSALAITAGSSMRQA
jgi:hypothetical protein